MNLQKTFISRFSLLIPSCLYITLVAPCLALIDENGNGVSDIWEQKYNAAALVTELEKDKDFDGDGFSNISEARSGTDPKDKNSNHRIDTIERNGTDVTLTCPTEKGKKYQIFSSTTMANGASWTEHGTAELASGSSMTSTLNGQSEDVKFFRVVVSDEDSDSDELTDWEEEQLEGFNPNEANSFDPSQSDKQIAQGMLTSLGNNLVTITADTADAYEKEDTTTKFTITRPSPSTYPMTVYFELSGHSDPSKGSVSTSDYILKKTNGDAITKNFIVIPAGALTAEIIVNPVADNLIEVPETLTCNISTTTNSDSVRICDAANTEANRRLFVARLTPVSGTGSTGSGIASMLLQGDNDIGLINMSFFGLKKAQSGAHIQYSNLGTQTNLAGLPGGQLTNRAYSPKAAQFLTTDQDVLDALFSGLIDMNVESQHAINGEIRGSFLLSTGSETFVAPAAAPAIEPLTGDALDRDIFRFLTQATFGPTPSEVDMLRNMITNNGGDRMAAYSAYLDTHLGLNGETAIATPSLEVLIHAADAQENYLARIVGSPDYQANYNHRERNRRRCWWTMIHSAPDQVRQRIAFALSEIFVVSGAEAVIDNRHYGMANYYDRLKENPTNAARAKNAFKTYREMIEDVSKHPIMGQYLSSLRNAKADGVNSPDENYAREVMQLFSIGLVHLHEDGSLKLSSEGRPLPTYDQVDISAMARVFTGWSFSVYNNPSTSSTVVPNTNFNLGNGRSYTYQDQWVHLMQNFSAFHDTDEKEMPTLGLTVEAGKTGEEDLDITLDHLANHPSTAPFIVRRLIQRLVTSNPSNGYIYRVVQVWKNTNGNLAEVAKAILLDYEARSQTPALADSYGKKKEPLIQYIALSRAMEAKSELPLTDLNNAANHGSYAYSPSKFAMIPAEIAKFPAGTTRFRMGGTDGSLGQTPMLQPSVFNYFLPDYSPAGTLSNNGLKTPEFQISTEVSVVKHINQHYSFLVNSSGIGGSQVPNQGEDPQYNPYNYATNADHMIPNRAADSHFIGKYLDVMDENNDGVVNDLDVNTFDNKQKIYDACEALIDELDLFLTSGQLKARYGAGFDYTTIRQDNPRDLILEAVYEQYDYYDDDGVSDPTNANYQRDKDRQVTVQQNRARWAAYLISISPYGMIQR